LQHRAANLERTTPAPVGSVDTALKQALALLEPQPAAALEQATEILKAIPGHPLARFLLGSAQRRLGQTKTAAAVLEELAREQPGAPNVHYELGLLRAQSGRGDDAVASLRCAAQLNPRLPGVWRVLADHLSAIGDTQGAEAARAQHIRMATGDPRLLAPAAALCENNIPLAETLLRTHLGRYPTDVAALRMLAEVAARIGRYPDAETLLARCLELAPGFADARAQYAMVLSRCNRDVEARSQIEQLLATEPNNPGFRNLKAAVLVGLGEYEQARGIYSRLLAEYPQQARIWLSHGHVLKTLGRQDESVAAYRRCLELNPGLGEAWWSLANLKTFQFQAQDVTAMQGALERSDCSDDDRLHLHFALGKAREDNGEFAPSFGHYAQANALRRAQLRYSADSNSRLVELTRQLFTPQFVREHAGFGCPAADPVFIVGMPRAGSTLVDQILASHSLVEGTMELSDMTTLARSLESEGAGRYPSSLAELPPERWRHLGESYLERTRVQRKTDRPFFIDKLPNNFLLTGLILLALPNAKIIDVRRDALACCFSNFKQHFARGQAFSYALEDLGRYYHDYVELMSHFEQVFAGRIHRIHYEELVQDTQTQVRALLNYCRLPFEEGCLRFHENRRAVRTASSEQVRQPIFRDGLDRWRNFEPWLDPLKVALGMA
jgi:tetratricopeptide (TPR) repeat protein